MIVFAVLVVVLVLVQTALVLFLAVWGVPRLFQSMNDLLRGVIATMQLAVQGSLDATKNLITPPTVIEVPEATVQERLYEVNEQFSSDEWDWTDELIPAQRAQTVIIPPTDNPQEILHSMGIGLGES